MTTQYQVVVLKKLLWFFYFIINLLGLWPFKFAQSRRQIKYSRFMALYCVTAFCFVFASYGTIGNSVFHSMRRNFFKTFTTNFVSYIYGYTLILVFCFVYIMPHIYRRKIEVSYSKCKKIFDVLNGFANKNLNIRAYLLEVVIKTVVIDIFLIILLGRGFIEGSEIPSIKLVLLFPLPIAMRLHFNVFYGVLLVLSVHFKNLNEKLDDIMTTAKIGRPQNNLIGRSHHLSDRIDEITITYCRLTEATKSINQIFSISTTLAHVLFVVSLTTQSLVLFARMIDIIQQGADVFLNDIQYIYILVIFCDIFTTAYCAERLVKEVRSF